MKPYRYFLVINKKDNSVVNFKMQPNRPQGSKVLEVLEVTVSTYVEVQGEY